MLEKHEKIFLFTLVISAIILIILAVYFTYRCPECDKTYSGQNNQPIIVYKI